MAESHDERERFTVLINPEGQYSVWPADREPPAGWDAAGKSGTKEECLEFVGQVWTDMRPRGLREKMDAP